jgi:hypothetical protein
LPLVRWGERYVVNNGDGGIRFGLIRITPVTRTSRSALGAIWVFSVVSFTGASTRPDSFNQTSLHNTVGHRFGATSHWYEYVAGKRSRETRRRRRRRPRRGRPPNISCAIGLDKPVLGQAALASAREPKTLEFAYLLRQRSPVLEIDWNRQKAPALARLKNRSRINSNSIT